MRYSNRWIALVVLSWTCLGSFQSFAGTGVEKEIWIGVRTDSVAGTGTATNPFDGSTQPKFDTLLSNLEGTTNLTIHLLPGVFQTKGNYDYVAGLQSGTDGWVCNSNWKIRGAGRDITVLRLTAAYNGANTGIATLHSGITGVEVSDLTVDCNAQGIGGSLNLQGVSLQGNNHKIQRVKVINASGATFEVFVICIGANSTPSSGNLIEDCEVSSWIGGGCTAIGMGNNNDAPANLTTGIIRGNRVVGANIAYGGFGMADVIFDSNYSEGCLFGVNIDSNSNKRVVLRGNKFLNTHWGVVMHNCEDAVLDGNLIENEQGGEAIYLSGDNHGVSLRNNEMRLVSGATSATGVRVEASGTTGLTFESNKVQAGMTNSVPSATAASIINNTNLTGGALSSFGNNVVYPVNQTGTIILGSNNLSDVASPSTARTNLGLGSLALENSDNVSITGGNISLSNASAKIQLENYGLLTIGGPGYGRMEIGYNDGTYAHIRTDSDRTLFLGSSNSNGVVIRNAMALTYDSAKPAITASRNTSDSRFAEFKDYGANVVAYIDPQGRYVGPNLARGTGSPEAAITGSVGDLYQRTDGTAATSLYLKESGTGNTGWNRVATVGGAMLSANQTLDFPATAAYATSSLTITCTGAALGSSVAVGLSSSPAAGIVYDAYVSSTNTVTLRAHNCTNASINPASASFRVTVFSN